MRNLYTLKQQRELDAVVLVLGVSYSKSLRAVLRFCMKYAGIFALIFVVGCGLSDKPSGPSAPMLPAPPVYQPLTNSHLV